MKEYAFHPVAELFPLLRGTEFNALAWQLCRERGAVTYRHYMEVSEFAAAARKRGIDAHSIRLPQDEPGGMDWLRKAVAHGFINYPFLAEHDPFLGDLRAEPGFRQILSEVKPRSLAKLSATVSSASASSGVTSPRAGGEPMW